MDELGYHMALDIDYITAQPVVPEANYQLHPLQGICLDQDQYGGSGHPVSMSGQVLLKLAAGDYVGRDCLKVAKYMARANLDQLLGGKPLQSRNLFQPIVSK